MIKLIFCIMLSFFIYTMGLSQVLKIELNELTTMDDDGHHIIILKTEPDERLILPALNLVKAKYSHVFYTWDVGDDQKIDLLIIPKVDAEELFIDINNDEDLTNDGPPLLFPYAENSLYFDIVSNSDPNQKTRIILFRQPEITDTLQHHLVDQKGNLNSKMAELFGSVNGVFNYKGEKGTYYFDKRITVRRGNVLFDNNEMKIGLFDYTNNGLFNDDRDLLIVDLDRNNKLEYRNSSEVFKLNDVFSIGSQNYKINSIDKYGKYIELIRTDEDATFYFLKEYQKKMAESAKKSEIKGELDQSFWNLSFETLSGEIVEMLDYKGKNLLLNFWGEWCKPCIMEIPDLVEAKDKI